MSLRLNVAQNINISPSGFKPAVRRREILKPYTSYVAYYFVPPCPFRQCALHKHDPRLLRVKQSHMTILVFFIKNTESLKATILLYVNS